MIKIPYGISSFKMMVETKYFYQDRTMYIENLEENSLELERIYVLKENIGKSIGQQLLDKVIRIAKEKNVAFIWLGVWEHNHRAIQFYQKN